MAASNTVTSGDYSGCRVWLIGGQISLYDKSSFTGTKIRTISRREVDSYEVLDESQKKSAGSAVTRGAVGALLLGPVGIAAALSAKSKGTYLVAIRWKDDKKSLIEIDDKTYKEFVKIMF